MKIYVGRWDLLPEEWEGINGLYEKSEKEIKAEISRQVDEMDKTGDNDNTVAIYTPAEFEETFNDDNGELNGGKYWMKIFNRGKSVLD